jgi:Fe2+ or Zn2+ uptake regulation protein
MMLSNKSNHTNEGLNSARASHHVVCSWCGAVIRSNAEEHEEQMCLICHARMLNDYFQKLKRIGDERRASRRF